MRRTLATAALSLVATGPALAQSEPPAYLDNRSDAAAIVRSFYNAISRQEYARAWGYFGDRKPSPSFDAFVKGYENTQSVSVVTGAESMEGAAGNTYYSVPVAFAAYNKDGSEQVFAGCYTARLSNPAVQEPPFRSLSIDSATLKAAQQPYEDAVPQKCGDGPDPEPQNAQLDQAKRAFVAIHYPECSAIKPDGTTAEPDTYRLRFRYQSDAADTPEREAKLYRFYCGSGAYNETHVYYLYEEDSGLREQQFATPELDVRYADGDKEAKVESVTIIGYTADDGLVNSFYDEKTMTIQSHDKWRGLGDASSSGTWLFRNGDFTLVKYDVDASYDEKIDPETVLDLETAP